MSPGSDPQTGSRAQGQGDPSEGLIHDWNRVDPQAAPPARFELIDDTLWGGWQLDPPQTPPPAALAGFLAQLPALPIRALALGQPDPDPGRWASRLGQLAEAAGEALRGLRAELVLAAPGPSTPALKARERLGLPISLTVCVPASPATMEASPLSPAAWLEELRGLLARSREEGLQVTVACLDAARARPEQLDGILEVALEGGAEGLGLWDTSGHALPEGVERLLGFARARIARCERRLALEWRGMNDKGQALPNALQALAHGADRIRASALGLGERAGGTSMDLLLVNLQLMGALSGPLSALRAYCQAASEAFRRPILANYPVLGADAFRTGTGVHAAAIVKAWRRGDAWLADRVYSGVPAAQFGFHQILEVGPMAGESNAIHWLTLRGLEPTRARIERIMGAAKASPRVLTDEELRAALGEG